MRRRTLIIKRLLAAAFAVSLVLIAKSESVLAQCAMCRAVAANAEDAAHFAKMLNLGILVLLIPPVAIFCGIFFLAYKHRNRARGASTIYKAPETDLWRRA